MEQQGKAGLIGEVIRIKTSGELALIIAEDAKPPSALSASLSSGSAAAGPGSGSSSSSSSGPSSGHSSPGYSYADIMVTVRAKNGTEHRFSLVDLDRFLALEETASFRILMRQKYPSVMIQ